MTIIAAICYVIVYVNFFQRFTLTDIGQIGRHSDGGVLANSEFGKALECGHFKFPSHTSLPGSTDPMPFVLVGDEAFPLRHNMMRPFPGRNLPGMNSSICFKF